MYIRSTPSARDMDCPAWAVAMASVGSVGLSAYKNRQKMSDSGLYPVSYTHLTLPTNREV